MGVGHLLTSFISLYLKYDDKITLGVVPIMFMFN